jgi:hypothetical protein
MTAIPETEKPQPIKHALTTSRQHPPPNGPDTILSQVSRLDIMPAPQFKHHLRISSAACACFDFGPSLSPSNLPVSGLSSMLKPADHVTWQASDEDCNKQTA